MGSGGETWPPDAERAVREIARLQARLDFLTEGIQWLARGFFHEVNNPLNHARLLVTVLSMRLKDLQDEEREMLKNSLTSCEHAHDLVKALNEYLWLLLKAVDPVNHIELRRVNVSNVLQDISRSDDLVTKSGMRISWDESPDVLADKSDLRRMFLEFLTSAVQRRRDDQLCVNVSCKLDDGECIFSVQDNGFGFDADDSRDIFAPFVRLEASAKLARLGMGLAFCRLLAVANGGRVWATSSPGEGTTFHLSLAAAGS